MRNIEKASAKVNELVQSGMKLSEAIREAAAEFGVQRSELWAEWEFEYSELWAEWELF